MKRYNLTYDITEEWGLREDPEGEWVRYEDALHELYETTKGEKGRFNNGAFRHEIRKLKNEVRSLGQTIRIIGTTFFGPIEIESETTEDPRGTASAGCNCAEEYKTEIQSKRAGRLADIEGWVCPAHGYKRL